MRNVRPRRFQNSTTFQDHLGGGGLRLGRRQGPRVENQSPRSKELLREKDHNHKFLELHLCFHSNNIHVKATSSVAVRIAPNTPDPFRSRPVAATSVRRAKHGVEKQQLRGRRWHGGNMHGILFIANALAEARLSAEATWMVLLLAMAVADDERLRFRRIRAKDPSRDVPSIGVSCGAAKACRDSQRGQF